MVLISIIVPVYNSETVLERCIGSILRQTLTQLEVIVIDDGSTDRSGSICDQYQEQDARIRVIHKKNGGVSAARNTGIELAEGRYIIFCDSDDYMDENACNGLYQMILRNPNGWIMGATHIVDESGRLLLEQSFSQEEISILDKSRYYDVYRLGVAGAPWNKIYDLATIRKHGLKFNESLNVGEDVVFNAQYIRFTDKIYILNKVVYYYVRYQSFQTATTKYDKDQFTHLEHMFSVRYPLIAPKDRMAFCTDYFFHFSNALISTWNKENPMNFLEKIKYNQFIVKSKVFQTTLKEGDTSTEDRRYLKLLRKQNYYLVYLLQRIVAIKRRLIKTTE